MRIRVRRLPGSLRLGLCALCLHLLSGLPGPAQAPQYSFSLAQGTHFFRRILFEKNLRPLESLTDLWEEPDTKLLIVLGETETLRRSLHALDAFVQRGGALLIATDTDCGFPVSRFGVEVRGSRLHVSAESKFAYKQSQECIFIQRYKQASDKEVPLFENLSLEGDLSRVATNRPGFLVRDRRSPLSVLATFPPGCVTLDGRILQPRLDAQGANFPFAMGGTCGQGGRVLILSDHSVFINEMMWQPDIENFDFACNCIDWLTNGGQRKEVLFFEEGQVQKSFEVSLKNVPPVGLPPLEALVETADKGLGELERDNAFNRLIHNAVREMTWLPDRWNRGVIITATVALALLGLTRLSQVRHRKEKGAPAVASGAAPPPRAPSLFEQRQQAMVQEGNFWEAARALARQAIESALGSPVQLQEHLAGAGPGSPPVLALRGNWWHQWRFRRRFKRLWQLAYGSDPVPISSRQLQRLNREIADWNSFLDPLGVRGAALPNHAG
jgi:hypothetical protein